MNAPDFDRTIFLAMAPDHPDRLIRLAAAYEKSTRSTLARLATAIEQGNHDLTRDLGHKLKSGSIWFGATALGAVGARLESLSLLTGEESAETLRAEAETSFTKVMIEVTEALAAMAGSQGDRHGTE